METTSVEVQTRLAERSAMSFARWPNARLLSKLSLDIALHLSLPKHRSPPAKTFSIKQTQTDVGAQDESDYLTEGALW